MEFMDAAADWRRAHHIADRAEIDMMRHCDASDFAERSEIAARLRQEASLKLQCMLAAAKDKAFSCRPSR